MKKLKTIYFLLLISYLASHLISCSKDEFIKEEASSEPKIYEQIIVYLYGEVKYPGLYNVDENTRVYELIEMAGGFTKNAKIGNLNLARILNNNEMIIVDKKEETTGDNEGNDKNQKININQADKTELMKLKGIGESKAEAIIDYRNKYGYFTKLEDLLKVKGISEKILNAIKDQVTI